MASPNFPEPPAAMPATPLADVDAAMSKLVANADKWVQVGISERAALLKKSMLALREIALDWAAATNRKRALNNDAPAGAEPWLTEIVPTMRNLRLLVESLEADAKPKLPKTWTRAGGQQVVKVFPCDAIDIALFTGIEAEVWIEPGQTATQGAIYRAKKRGEYKDGKVGLVLGAGNVGSILPTDALYKLFVDDEVTIIKTNPVNDYLGPMWQALLKPFIDEGYCAIVHGGAEVGIHLCNHPDVASIHITGSDRTYDAIVWGPGEAGQERKQTGERANERHVSAELGCVTPVFVVPGRWSDADIAYHARGIASMVTNNASFNCVAAKALVTASGWPQREQFLKAFRQALSEIPSRKAYYPGARDRYDAFVAQYPRAKKLSADGEGLVPWTVIGDVKPTKDEYALCNEAFCGVIAEVALDAKTAEDFIEEMVRFGNDEIWGTLSCTIIIDGKTQKRCKDQVEQALADLRYGGIALNVFSGFIFAMASPTWGAFPGHTPDDIRSGTDVVHNSYLLDHPQRSIVRAPFRIRPAPIWFEGHPNALTIGKLILDLEMKRTWLKIPRLAALALAS
jgi:acyl-CoA reductase-like NAD-dependent aldehyde dehydrogenase